MSLAARIAVWSLLGALAPLAAGQEKPLERSFSAGTAVSYRIQLIVRSDIEGQQPEPIGVKAYVRAFSRFAEDGLAWTATRRVVALGNDGAAEIEETLGDFEGLAGSSTPGDPEAEKLARSLREVLSDWKRQRTLRYRETRSGQLLELKADGVPPLGETPPPLLSLWLLRALRPAVALPEATFRTGERWQEARTAQLANWAEVSGSEAGEWLDLLGGVEPAARLHIVQQLFGTVVAGPEKPPEGAAQARFHGESLNTVSLGDARLFAATRSAMREITWTLAPVEGLPEQPRFRARLSLQVQIDACNETPCLSADRPAERER
ncbi:MAG: hypothetical protein WAR21_02065 [Candidatus Acidiferrales bacterium]